MVVYEMRRAVFLSRCRHPPEPVHAINIQLAARAREGSCAIRPGPMCDRMGRVRILARRVMRRPGPIINQCSRFSRPQPVSKRGRLRNLEKIGIRAVP